MAVQDVMKPGIGPRRACKILTVDPLNRQIEAMLKDATTVQVAVFDTPGLFIWPKVGEYWTIHRREGFWMLDHRVESYDDEQKIADLNPGEGRIDADIIKTISGKDLIAINTPKNTTEDISLVYSNGEWVTKSLNESLIGESETNKSVMILDSSSVKADEDSLITYKNTSWIPTHDIKVHSLEVDGKSFIDNSLIYGAGTISVNTDGVVTGSNTTFNKDMANGKMTIGTTSYQIIDFYSATSLKINRSGTAIPSNTQYSITYYPKASTAVKIGNNASITVGSNSDFLIKNSDSYYVKITSDGNFRAVGGTITAATEPGSAQVVLNSNGSINATGNVTSNKLIVTSTENTAPDFAASIAGRLYVGGKLRVDGTGYIQSLNSDNINVGYDGTNPTAVNIGNIQIRNLSAIYSGGNDNPNDVGELNAAPKGSLYLSCNTTGEIFRKISSGANWSRLADASDVTGSRSTTGTKGSTGAGVGIYRYGSSTSLFTLDNAPWYKINYNPLSGTGTYYIAKFTGLNFTGADTIAANGHVISEGFNQPNDLPGVSSSSTYSAYWFNNSGDYILVPGIVRSGTNLKFWLWNPAGSSYSGTGNLIVWVAVIDT